MIAREVLGSGTALEVLSKNVKDRRNVFHDAHGQFTHSDVSQNYGVKAAAHVRTARQHVESGLSQEAANSIARAAVAGAPLGKPMSPATQMALLGLPGVTTNPSATGGHSVSQGGQVIGTVNRTAAGKWGHSKGGGGFNTRLGATLHLLHTHNGYYTGQNRGRSRRQFPWKRRAKRGMGRYYDEHITAHLDAPSNA
jgi:hypothetical protein